MDYLKTFILNLICKYFIILNYKSTLFMSLFMSQMSMMGDQHSITSYEFWKTVALNCTK